ncbi:hypothetical protein TsFJ059_009325 [Trichoderma semiorbis]|uniref:Uncharacterized protein n=1 Tax=Trichoderma semiorbis TaxID=1491008 RepID=A0A9P8HJB7_9HYPO|nr:hypothetical protein TsFJ059_009325 [Trichoderma semiorbis]
MKAGSSRTAKEPQLKTRIRRWRRYQPPTIECGNDSVAETTSSGQSNRRVRKRIGLEFINTAHPHDATSSTAISSIRSHAARNIHASHRASASHSKGSGKGRRTQMDTNEASPLSIYWPVHLMVPVYSGLLHCFARPMTKFEHFLLDYYAASVIPDAHLWCHHGDEEPLFIEGVRLYWLPFVVTDSGLLAGIFLSSCRNLALCEHQPHANHEYSQLAMMYKLECIRSVNEAIAAEGPTITETTIAKTLLLCADEFMCDDLNASALHFEGMNNMIKLKGGLSNVGVNGFLRKALKWCNLENILKISLPNYNLKSTRDTI